jgi:hypothetical protein
VGSLDRVSPTRNKKNAHRVTTTITPAVLSGCADLFPRSGLIPVDEIYNCGALLALDRKGETVNDSAVQSGSA